MKLRIRLFPGAEDHYIKSKVRFRPPPTGLPSETNDMQEGEELVTIASNDPSDIIKRAKEIMKISETDKFSYSVLSIEYHFPDPASSTHAPRLTLIDLPGLVAVVDGDTLEAYTRKYIERKTALVLAVADGTADPENLRILKVVNDSACADRTFGIITKPDMMYPKSALEAVWVRQVMDPNPRQFGLGSHVVCNRSPSELQPGAYQRTLDDRDSREADFFAAETRFPPNATENGENQKLPNGWHRVYTMKPSDRWGIQNLRNRLVALLSDMACERVLPIYRGVQAAIKKKRDELAVLKGKDPKQMKAHLKDAVNHLRKLAAQASIGSYKEQPSTKNYKSRPYFIISQDSCRWLRSKIDERSHEFSKTMRREGHNSNEYPWSPDEDLPTDLKSEDVNQMLTLLRRTQAGTLPSEFGHDILDLVFSSFSEPWHKVASEYLDQCYVCCESFVCDLVRFVLDDQAYAERLLAKEILVRLEDRKEAALATLELLEHDRKDAPMSVHPDMWMAARENTIKLAQSYKTAFQSVKPQQATPQQGNQQAKPNPQNQIQLEELAIVNQTTALKQLQNIMLVYKVWYYSIDRRRLDIRRRII
ncbi:hypothetical protein THAR02_00597 [Trichoderma harzianum]|uniref:Dynamin N-terminal domain-containing protein n=1 Tax=Trichoderma harzianum TaxID=5544 RepID=A0A0F9Y5I8_TRIHA|nr:hypothetical protein THAR02_00597 [Trichoderma harzianum]